MELTNKTTGNALKIFLIMGIVLSSIQVITSFFYANLYNEVYLSLKNVDYAIGIFYSIIWITTIIVYLIWIFKVHADLRNIESDYPIKPSGALARILIPIYNLYGIWNIFSTMAAYFKRYDNALDLAKKLGAIIPFYYILYFGTNLLNQLIVRGVLQNDQLYVLSIVLDTILMAVYLIMTKTILSALHIISSEFKV